MPSVSATLREAARLLAASQFKGYVDQAVEAFRSGKDFPEEPRLQRERLCYELAKVTPLLAVAAAEDGGWTYTIPDPIDEGSFVVVSCREGDDGLDVEVEDSDEVDANKLRYLANDDHWTRVLAWGLQTALETGATDEDIEDLHARFTATQALSKLAEAELPEQRKAYWRLHKKGPDLRPMSIGCSASVVLKGKIGRHEGPRQGLSYSVLTVHPAALKNLDYLKAVVKHELIHYVLGERDVESPHDELFESMAKEVGLDDKYRD